MHHQREQISQPLMFRTRRGQLVATRQAMAAVTLLLAELLCRLSERARRLRYMGFPTPLEQKVTLSPFSQSPVTTQCIRMRDVKISSRQGLAQPQVDPVRVCRMCWGSRCLYRMGWMAS